MIAVRILSIYTDIPQWGIFDLHGCQGDDLDNTDGKFGFSQKTPAVLNR